MTSLPGNPQNRSLLTRRSESPRKVRGGLKLAGTLLNKDAPSQTNGAGQVARRFQTLWESALDPQALAEGLEYARIGQIIDVEFRTGVVEAHVQGTLPKPYIVQLTVPVLDDEQWQRAIETMSGEAVYVAKLLAGELPADIDDRLKASGIEFVPSWSDAIGASCTCSAGAAPRGARLARCKHVAALAYLAAERLLNDPLLILSVLGKSSQNVLELLRQARVGPISLSGNGPSAPILPAASCEAPLELCIDDFWRSPLRSDEWNQLENQTTGHYVPHALLRRLGPSPMNGRFPLVGLLASIYDAVSEAARQMSQPSDQDGNVTDTDPSR